MSPAAPDVSGTVFEDEAPEATRSYAEALLGAAEKEGQVDAVLDELDAIASDVLRRTRFSPRCWPRSSSPPPRRTASWSTRSEAVPCRPSCGSSACSTGMAGSA